MFGRKMFRRYFHSLAALMFWIVSLQDSVIAFKADTTNHHTVITNIIQFEVARNSDFNCNEEHHSAHYQAAHHQAHLEKISDYLIPVTT